MQRDVLFLLLTFGLCMGVRRLCQNVLDETFCLRVMVVATRLMVMAKCEIKWLYQKKDGAHDRKKNVQAVWQRCNSAV